MSIEDFLVGFEDVLATDDTPKAKRTPLELEVWRRIKLSIAAYSYEFWDDSIISDAEFDQMSREVNPSVKTGNKKMDKFFKEEFDPSTGSWIHRHPELNKIQRLYETYYRK